MKLHLPLKGGANETVDKTTDFRQFDEKFSPAFFKRRRGGGCVSLLAEHEVLVNLLASSFSCRGRNSLFYGAFLFVSANSRSDLRRACEPIFILRLFRQKKKRNKNIYAI